MLPWNGCRALQPPSCCRASPGLRPRSMQARGCWRLQCVVRLLSSVRVPGSVEAPAAALRCTPTVPNMTCCPEFPPFVPLTCTLLALSRRFLAGAERAHAAAGGGHRAGPPGGLHTLGGCTCGHGLCYKQPLPGMELSPQWMHRPACSLAGQHCGCQGQAGAEGAAGAGGLRRHCVCVLRRSTHILPSTELLLPAAAGRVPRRVAVRFEGSSSWHSFSLHCSRHHHLLMHCPACLATVFFVGRRRGGSGAPGRSPCPAPLLLCRPQDCPEQGRGSSRSSCPRILSVCGWRGAAGAAHSGGQLMAGKEADGRLACPLQHQSVGPGSL